MKRWGMFLIALLVGLGLAHQAAWAGYPEKEIKIIVGSSPGGGIDRMTRSVQRFLPDILKVSVLVENQGGAGGKIALRNFLKAPADGHTLFVHLQPTMTVLKAKEPDLFKFDDLAFINVNWTDPCILVANKKTGWKSLDDMIQAVKKEPGKYSFSIPGLYTTGHLMAEMLFKALKLEIKMVPYNSGGAARTALRGGHVDMTAGGAEGMLVIEDVCEALGVYWSKPLPDWPKAPLVNDILTKYNLKMPRAGSIRFFATHGEFKRKQPENYKILVDGFQKLITGHKAYQEFCDKSKIGRDWLGPQESTEAIMEADEVFSKMKLGE